MVSDHPEWDEAFAIDCLGKTVLIGLTHCDPSGEVRDQSQQYGLIEEADPSTGFRIGLAGVHQGERRWLPPDPGVFEKAEPGVYRLRSTGEEVENPDFLCRWTVTDPE